MHQKACRTCSTIICPHSTNQITGLWRWCCRCCRHFSNSFMSKKSANWFVALLFRSSFLKLSNYFKLRLTAEAPAILIGQTIPLAAKLGSVPLRWKRCQSVMKELTRHERCPYDREVQSEQGLSVICTSLIGRITESRKVRTRFSVRKRRCNLRQSAWNSLRRRTNARNFT